MALADGIRPDAGVPYLRKNQLERMESEEKRLVSSLNDPGVRDKEDAARSLQRLRHQRDRQTAPAMTPLEKDKVVRLEQELLADLKVAVPSDQEMRHMPSGAVERHIDWEDRIQGPLKMKNRRKIHVWKNLRVLLGLSPNFEPHRPQTSKLNLEDSFIPTRNFQAVSRPKSSVEGLNDRIRWTLIFDKDPKRKALADAALYALDYLLGDRQGDGPTEVQEAALEIFVKEIWGNEEGDTETEPIEAMPAPQSDLSDLAEPAQPEVHPIPDL